MKRTIIIITITICLFSFATFELIQVNNITNYIETQINTLPSEYETNKDDISNLYEKVENIATYWNDSEDALCLIFSHKDLSLTTDTLTRLLAYTRNNDYDNAIIELTLLKEIASKNYHIMGFNIHNVL